VICPSRPLAGKLGVPGVRRRHGPRKALAGPACPCSGPSEIRGGHSTAYISDLRAGAASTTIARGLPGAAASNYHANGVAGNPRPSPLIDQNIPQPKALRSRFLPAKPATPHAQLAPRKTGHFPNQRALGVAGFVRNPQPNGKRTSSPSSSSSRSRFESDLRTPYPSCREAATTVIEQQIAPACPSKWGLVFPFTNPVSETAAVTRMAVQP